MSYNCEYFDIKFSLINAFLIDASESLVDISYSVESKKIIIQVVVTKDSVLNVEDALRKLKTDLREYEIVINEVSITKDKFNENKGDWQPKYYHWLPYLLFSKAEVL